MPDFRHILNFPVQKFKKNLFVRFALIQSMWSGVPCARHARGGLGGLPARAGDGDLDPKPGFRSLGRGFEDH
jgi:hypothetical protein